MPFYVHAQDRPGALTELAALSESHWSYMDLFAGRLILRGPTLSDDGTEHTGSVHVVDLDDRASAERFATEEPFWQAGLYRDLTVARAVVLHHQKPTGGQLESRAPDALITGHWPARRRDTSQHLPGPDPDSRLSFLAMLVDDDQSWVAGIVSVVSALPGAAAGIVRPFVDQLAGEPVPLTAQRWTPGGRS